MEQNIHGDNLGQVVNANTVNINNNDNDSIDARPIVPAQRKALNNLISDIEGYCDLTARDIWLSLHAQLGVSSINEIMICQYEKAESFLKKNLHEVMEKDTCKRLMHYILKEIANKNELKNKMNRYCQEQFGTSDLKTINKEQLQKVLSYIRNEAEQQSIQQKDFVNQVITLVKLQPKPALIIFIAGFILGAIVF